MKLTEQKLRQVVRDTLQEEVVLGDVRSGRGVIDVKVSKTFDNTVCIDASPQDGIYLSPEGVDQLIELLEQKRNEAIS